MAVAVGRELFITIRITYSKLKPACVLYRGVKTELDAVSSEPNRQYETQQGAAVKPGLWVDTTSSVDIFGVNYKILFPFYLRLQFCLLARSSEKCFVIWWSCHVTWWNMSGGGRRRATKWEDRSRERCHILSRLHAQIHFKHALASSPDMWRFSLKLSRSCWLFASVSFCFCLPLTPPDSHVRSWDEKVG